MRPVVEGMMPVSGQVTTTLRERAMLRKRFTDIDSHIARAVGAMADFEAEREKREPPPFRVHVEIVPDLPFGPTLAAGWRVWVCASGRALPRAMRFPVIPDSITGGAPWAG